MTLSRTVLLMSSVALALFCGAAQAQPAAQGGKPMMTLQMPATPDPARVTLDPKTTALIVLDYVEEICSRQPSCKGQMLPAMTPFMGRVRKAGLVVAYGTREHNMTHWLKEVAPAPGDIKVINTAQDRFLQHRPRQDAEGEGHQDAHHGRLEDQRFGDLYLGRSDGARLHRRHSDGYDLDAAAATRRPSASISLELGQCNWRTSP